MDSCLSRLYSTPPPPNSYPRKTPLIPLILVNIVLLVYNLFLSLSDPVCLQLGYIAINQLGAQKTVLNEKHCQVLFSASFQQLSNSPMRQVLFSFKKLRYWGFEGLNNWLKSPSLVNGRNTEQDAGGVGDMSRSFFH